MKKLVLVFAALLMAIPATVSARGGRGGHGHGNGHYVRPVVRVSYGPAYRPWGWYSPYAYGYGFGGFPVYTQPTTGQVKLDTPVKDADVYIDGAFAGTVGELKSLRLEQGSYNLEIRAPGRTRYAERIYVINGKTLKVRPELRVE